MDLEVEDAQDVRVVEALKEAELALGGPLDVWALLLAGGAGDPNRAKTCSHEHARRYHPQGEKGEWA